MNIDKIKIYYYLNTNKKNLFELKHDSHFLKILGKNIDLINEIIPLIININPSTNDKNVWLR